MTRFLRPAVFALSTSLFSAEPPKPRNGSWSSSPMTMASGIDWKKYATWGCDIESWLKEGMLDYLVVGQHGLGGYDFDIAPFVKMAMGSGCAVIFGEEATVKGHDVTAEEDRLIAARQDEAPAPHPPHPRALRATRRESPRCRCAGHPSLQ